MLNGDETLEQLNAEHEKFIDAQLKDIELSEQCRSFLDSQLGLHLRKFIVHGKSDQLLQLMSATDPVESDKIRFEYEVLDRIMQTLCTILMAGEEAKKMIESKSYDG